MMDDQDSTFYRVDHGEWSEDSLQHLVNPEPYKVSQMHFVFSLFLALVRPTESSFITVKVYVLIATNIYSESNVSLTWSMSIACLVSLSLICHHISLKWIVLMQQILIGEGLAHHKRFFFVPHVKLSWSPSKGYGHGTTQVQEIMWGTKDTYKFLTKLFSVWSFTMMTIIWQNIDDLKVR